MPRTIHAIHVLPRFTSSNDMIRQLESGIFFPRENLHAPFFIRSVAVTG